MATKAKKDEKKSIVRPYKTTILVTLTGTSDLLSNPSTETLVDNLIAGRNPGKDMRPAKEQAQDRILKDDDGNYIVPRSWVFACLREGGREIPYKTVREKITSATKGTKLPSLLKIHHAGYVIHDDKGNPITDDNWEVDKQKGNNTNAGKGRGTAVGIVRPRIKVPWAIDVEMTVRTDRIDLERIIQLLEVAGEQYGLGDARPGMGKLDFGMFQATRVQVLGTQKAPPRLVIEGLEKLTEVEPSGPTDTTEVAATADEAGRKEELVPVG